MERPNLGEQGQQILTHFRTVAKSYTDLFRAQRNHVHQLLKGAHHYSSGVFREGLIRNFLKTVLPQSVAVDSGFVYGFDQIDNSRQIDILVWDCTRYAAVYRTQEFVIVPPEAVIAALAVKTTLEKADITDALDNLLSLTPLELLYRSILHPESGEPAFRPITKIVLSYEGPSNPDTALATIGTFFQQRFATDARLAAEMVSALKDFNPVRPTKSHVYQVERVIPKLVAVIETAACSFLQGWGPPEDLLGTQTFGPGLRRLPYLYRQENRLTTPLEKVVYYVLEATYATFKTPGWSLVAAWGEFNPATGIRVGDAAEMLEQTGVRLLDPDNLPLSVA